MNEMQWIAIVVVLLITIIFLAIFAQYASLWLQCKMTRARVSLVKLIMMRFRKVNPVVIVRSMIMAVQSGITQNYPIWKPTTSLVATFPTLSGH